jgi:hypothetical protein
MIEAKDNFNRAGLRQIVHFIAYGKKIKAKPKAPPAMKKR